MSDTRTQMFAQVIRLLGEPEPADQQLLELAERTNADLRERLARLERWAWGCRCSFCGKRQDEVRHMVAGPAVFICDECIGLCAEIVPSQEAPVGFKVVPIEPTDAMVDQFWRCPVQGFAIGMRLNRETVRSALRDAIAVAQAPSLPKDS